MPRNRVYFSERTFIRLLITILLIAIASRMVDRFILRPPEDYFSVASYRESRKSGSNLFSICSAITLPLVLVLFAKLKHLVRTRPSTHLFVSLCLLLLLIDVYASGSRGILLVCLTALFFDRITIRNLLPVLAVIAVLSSAMFLARFSNLMGTDSEAVATVDFALSGYGYFVPASLDLYDYFIDSKYVFLTYFFVQTLQYLSHGFFEFAYLFATHSHDNFSVSMLIPQLNKVFDQPVYIERENLYYTLFGTAFIAFGLYSPIILAFTGAALGWLYRRACIDSVAAKGIVLLALFLSPFVNSIGGYDIIFFLISIFISSFFAVRPRFKGSFKPEVQRQHWSQPTNNRLEQPLAPR